MKILVTGYKGFIGQNMVNALKDEHELSYFEWGDEIPDFRELDWCIHLGAITSTTETNVERVIDQNYDFSRFILNACQTNNVNFQYASSASVYGLNNNFSETSPADPKSPYAWSKYLFDRYVQGFSSRWTIRVQGFRYFNVYGPHEDHKGDQASPYHKFEQQAKEKGVIQIFEGSKNYLRDFIHVDKIVETHKKFFNINESGLWNLGIGSVRSFEDIARELAEKYGAAIEYIPMPENIKKQYQTYTCADLTKLNKTLEL
jgi:ADP-L-glycero-D-manno-heptose 6-epimerase